MFNIFTTSQLVKVSTKVWLKFYELNFFFELAIWACGAAGKSDSFLILQKRVKDLYQKFNKTGNLKGFAIYLKEALRITIYFLGDQTVVIGPNSPMIKRDSHGLPTIIPWLLRKELLDFKSKGLSGNKGVVVCILTVLSVFRIFSNVAKPNLGSILKPFSGTTKSFDSRLLKSAIKNLSFGSLRLKSPKLLLIEKASPNASKSTWSSSLDAVAFLFYPRTLIAYCKYALGISHGWIWLVWLFVILVVSLPAILLIKVLGGSLSLCIAKLGVVHDQSGKARIVGITNYWIQVILKPLHDAILSNLRNIPMDGTFDQIAPIKRLMSLVEPGQKLYSFDLSSATDRLPVEIQADILNLLIPNLGTNWMNLLGSLVWRWKSTNSKVPLKEIKYAVGQPMGAYSSWAMLALSHHLIVQCAAVNCKIKSFTHYAVLGDDIVIANDAVAAEYLVLMKQLGVDINLSKSLSSSSFCEFAKRWIGPNGLDLSPVGPGLILRTIRSKLYLAGLLHAMFSLGLIQNLQATLASISSLSHDLHKKYKGQRWNALWAAFGLNSFLTKGSQGGNNNFMQLLSWCFSISERTLASAPFLIKSALVQVIIEDRAKAQSNLNDAVKYFSNNWWKTMTARGWPNRMLEFLLKVISPGWWAYVSNFADKQLELDASLGCLSGDYSVQGLIHTISHDPFAIDVQNIDWKDRDAVKSSVERGSRILKAYDIQMDDLMFAGDPSSFY